MLDKLEMRLSRYRDKVRQYREGKPRSVRRVGSREKGPQIIMLRRIDAKPMDPEEAHDAARRLRATALSYSASIERGNVCVMYKRKDGNFGLVETTGRAL